MYRPRYIHDVKELTGRSSLATLQENLVIMSAHSVKPQGRRSSRRRAKRQPTRAKESLAQALDAELARLSQVESILGCLAFALTYSREVEARPSYSQAEVAEAARTLLLEVIQNLESLQREEKGSHAT